MKTNQRWKIKFKCSALVVGLEVIFFLAQISRADSTNTSSAVSAEMLTPRAGPAPRINGPLVYGCRPEHPFLYRIPVQGERPMALSVSNLPSSLKFETKTGFIIGTVPPQGSFDLTLVASNSHGIDTRSFKIVSGDKLLLTPPMGWNHWNAHYTKITDTIIRQSADAMVSSGMADVGYNYVDLDDCWANKAKDADPLRVGAYRDKQGNLIPNNYFPDMKALADYVHSKGFKAGIYSSPGPTTCGSCAGSYQHEDQDARQFADWGYDLLKYDWCSYRRIAGTNPPLEKLEEPYIVMGRLLREQNRDMAFSICQYGMGAVWDWGESVGGQYWRTSRDGIYDITRFFECAVTNALHGAAQKPGAWNDPDFLLIGQLSRGPCPLTPTERYSFMSLWCLMGAPLIFSGDLSKLDDFTLNVLCNPEVIAIDQDALGKCGRVERLSDTTFLMIKELADGGRAVGFCNQGKVAQEINARWSDMGLAASQPVRDLWREKDLGQFDGAFSVKVPARGVFLVRVGGAGS